MGAQAIKLGDAKIVIAGGQESMSQAQHSAHLRTGIKMGNGSLVDTMITDGLTDAFTNIHMGITGTYFRFYKRKWILCVLNLKFKYTHLIFKIAENVAAKYNITREEQDEFAYKSQHKAGIALKEGHFKEEIVSISVPGRKGAVEVNTDEFPRPETTVESLKSLRPAFIRDATGTVTAGNASGINDGAAAIALASESLAKSMGLKPLARIIAYASSGVDPKIMGIGPIPAVQTAVKNNIY